MINCTNGGSPRRVMMAVPTQAGQASADKIRALATSTLKDILMHISAPEVVNECDQRYA